MMGPEADPNPQSHDADGTRVDIPHGVVIENTTIDAPGGAIDLYPNKIGPRILHLPDKNQILKVGPSVKMSEAEVMRFVALQTSVPVPQVLESYVRHGHGYILMSKVHGEPVADVWKDFTPEQRVSVIDQLRDYTVQLGALRGTFLVHSGIRPAKTYSSIIFHLNTKRTNTALTALDSNTMKASLMRFGIRVRLVT
jgi:hypothetical protein